MNRPTGVAVIALLEFFIATLLVLVALSSALGIGLIGAVLSRSPDLAPGFPFLAGAGMIMAVAVPVPAAFLGVLGYGLWNLKNWAWIGTVVLVVLGAIGASFGISWSLFRFRMVGLMVSSVRLGIDLLVLWYLSQAPVRSVFQ
jgi:hypothetical protein